MKQKTKIIWRNEKMLIANQNEPKNEQKIIAMWTLSNYGGLQVVEMYNDESMNVRWYDEEKTTEHEIIYELNEDSNEYEACINYNDTLYWLSECMKVS